MSDRKMLTAGRCVLVAHFIGFIGIGFYIAWAQGHSYWSITWFVPAWYLSPILGGYILGVLEHGWKLDVRTVEWKDVVLWPFALWKELDG